MYDNDNIFAQIIEGKISCKKVYEDENILAFHDIYPSAPVHVLVIPKALAYTSFSDFVSKSETKKIADFFQKIGEIAKILNLNENGYRLITNHGRDAVQTVKHFHVHILGGENLGPLLINDQQI